MEIGCSLSVSTSAVGFIVFPDPSADPATMGRDACLLFEALVGRILIVRSGDQRPQLSKDLRTAQTARFDRLYGGCSRARAPRLNQHALDIFVMLYPFTGRGNLHQQALQCLSPNRRRH